MASLGGAVTGPEELTADLAVGQWSWQWDSFPGSGKGSLAVEQCPWQQDTVPVGLLSRAGSSPPRWGLWARQPCWDKELLHLLNRRTTALGPWRLFILALINPSGLYIKRAVGERILQPLQVLKSWAGRAVPEASVAKRPPPLLLLCRTDTGHCSCWLHQE